MIYKVRLRHIKKKMKMIKIKVMDEKAVIPTRSHPKDIGYDLTAIRKHKTLASGAVIYDTGLAVSPPKGYYLEILPRSSMSKTGYVLANSVGTIDPGYNSNLYIALYKVNPKVEDLAVPFCKCQLVLRKAEYAELLITDNLEYTDRGEGSFGSTDAKFNRTN